MLVPDPNIREVHIEKPCLGLLARRSLFPEEIRLSCVAVIALYHRERKGCFQVNGPV